MEELRPYYRNPLVDSGTLFDLVNSGWKISTGGCEGRFPPSASLTPSAAVCDTLSLDGLHPHSVFPLSVFNDGFPVWDDVMEHEPSESSTCESRILDSKTHNTTKLVDNDEVNRGERTKECLGSNLTTASHSKSQPMVPSLNWEDAFNHAHLRDSFRDADLAYRSHDLSPRSTNPPSEFDQLSEVDSCDGEETRDLSPFLDFSHLENFRTMSFEQRDSNACEPVHGWAKGFETQYSDRFPHALSSDPTPFDDSIEWSDERLRVSANTGARDVCKATQPIDPFEFFGGSSTLGVDNFIPYSGAMSCLNKFAAMEKDAGFEFSTNLSGLDFDSSRCKDFGSDESLWSVVQLASGK